MGSSPKPERRKMENIIPDLQPPEFTHEQNQIIQNEGIYTLS